MKPVCGEAAKIGAWGGMFMGKITKFKPRRNYNAFMARQNNAVGKKIGEARKEAKLTQGEFAAKLSEYGVDVKTPAVNKWEHGENIPNAYQLLAICHALGIKEGLDFFTGHIMPISSSLNAEGRRLAKRYIEYLESQDRYTNVRPKIREIPVQTALDCVSAGIGEDFIADDEFEEVLYPESVVPDGTDFAIRIDGDSMEPAYHDGQVVFVEKCETLNDGEVGIMYNDGRGYMKVYREMMPVDEDVEECTDSYGNIHPQVYLFSYNKAKYGPIRAQPDFRIFGRVLN
jgi:phage repressor protein C with HTH and peptisase S24 domain